MRNSISGALYKTALIFYKTAVIFLLALLVSCGRKGVPTLTTFAKPEPIGGITAVHRENSILLSWSYPLPSDMQEIIKGFYLDKAEGAGDESTRVFRNVAFLKNNVTHYDDKEFAEGKAYFYRVRVCNFRGIISDPSPVIKVEPAVLPLPPSELFYDVKNDAVEIRWNKSPGNVKYNIYKGHDKNVFAGPPLNKMPLTGPFFRARVETELSTFYVVRSLIDSNIKDEGFPSGVLEVDPSNFVPSKPEGLKFVYAGSGLVLMWNENPETWVRRYKIYRKRAGEKTFDVIGEAVTPTFKDNGPLTSGTTYYITAIGPARESAPIEPIEVNPQVVR